MKCCANCIGDYNLSIWLFIEPQAGYCDFCKKSTDKLIDPLLARDYFELLLEIYKQDTHGQNLAETLTQDWNLFAGQDVAHVQLLLAEILGDGNKVRGTWSAVNQGQEVDLIGKWELFKQELIHQNRFFPNDDFIPLFDQLRESFGSALTFSQNLGPLLYRARICENDQPYCISEMGAPPPKKVGNGRANPNGIPYLYLASDPHTAISEVRPNPSDQITLVEVRAEAGLKLVDLIHPRKRFSPFMFDDAEQMASLRVKLHFMERLSQELSRPILPRSASLDYLPTQFVSEAIKHYGFDGIIFQSSVANGFNVAIFDPSKASIGNPTMHKVTKVGFEFEGVVC